MVIICLAIFWFYRKKKQKEDLLSFKEHMLKGMKCFFTKLCLRQKTALCSLRLNETSFRRDNMLDRKKHNEAVIPYRGNAKQRADDSEQKVVSTSQLVFND